MLLSKIKAEPGRFQFREGEYSEETVCGIIAEGMDVSKFDPIPVIGGDGGKFIVAGDGHSRLEAIRRLEKAGRLPQCWRSKQGGGKVGWDIPVRRVTSAEAKRLAWTANLNRTPFTPSEQARVFKAMVDDGLSIDEIAKIVHSNPCRVVATLKLNGLCRDIRMMIGKSAEAGGIDEATARVLAVGFERYGIAPDRQQQLWHSCLKDSTLNFQSAAAFLRLIGAKMGERSEERMLFEIPVNAGTVVAEAKARSSAARTAKKGLGLLLAAADAGGLDELPELKQWLVQNGERARGRLTEQLTQDAEALAGIVFHGRKHSRPRTGECQPSQVSAVG